MYAAEYSVPIESKVNCKFWILPNVNFGASANNSVGLKRPRLPVAFCGFSLLSTNAIGVTSALLPVNVTIASPFLSN